MYDSHFQTTFEKLCKSSLKDREITACSPTLN